MFEGARAPRERPKPQHRAKALISEEFAFKKESLSGGVQKHKKNMEEAVEMVEIAMIAVA